MTAGSGILAEHPSPGAATCVVVGPLTTTAALALDHFHAVCWLVTADGRAVPPRVPPPAALEVHVLDETPDAALEIALARFLPRDPRHLPHLIITTGVLQQHLGRYECAVELLHRVVERTRRARFTRQQDGFTWQKHLLVNIAEFVRRQVPAGWAGALRGLPACVCGAGPSLDVSAPVLARRLQHAVIIAADSAVRALARHGVTADFVVSIDAHKRPENCLAPDAEPGRVVLASVSPPGWREAVAAERCFFVPSRQITESWLQSLGLEHPPVAATESCGSTGLELAHFLGCAPIHLFGLDLAADPREPARRRAADANPVSYAGESLAAAGREPRVPGNYVPELPTYLFSDWQALDVRLTELPPGLVINVNDRGARLRNTALVHPAALAVTPPASGKRIALSHLPAPAAAESARGRAALAALGAEGARGAREIARLREVLARRGVDGLVAALRTLLATGDFARAMGAYSFKLMPHLAPPVEEGVTFWEQQLEELEELCCLAQSVYEVSLT